MLPARALGSKPTHPAFRDGSVVRSSHAMPMSELEPRIRNRFLPSMASLLAFDSAARHGSFTRSASELNVTQSAISRQIRQLEDLLGVRLFERVRQHVVLTDAGKVYLESVGQILESLSIATTELMSSGNGQEVFNLAVLPTFATRWLLPRLPEFIQAHPSVVFHFSNRLEPFDLNKEPFDAALHYGSNFWDGAVTHHLLDEEMVPVSSPQFRQENRLTHPEQLLGAILLHQSTRPNAWSEWFRTMGIESRTTFRGPRFEQFGMIAQAAISGLGVALVPEFFVEKELASGELVRLFDQLLHSKDAYYLAVPETKAALPLIQAFTTWIVERARADTRLMQSASRR